MISIRIDEPKKLPYILVKYSAFISFQYNPEVVEYLKKLTNRFYHAETKEWEIPYSLVAKFCNNFKTIPITIEGIYVDESKTELTEIPPQFEFKTSPFSHQLQGIRFALTQRRFILADEQGLGKTKQIIDWSNILLHENKIKRTLIICGVNSLKYNWLQEVSIHSNKKAWVLGTRYRKSGKPYEGSSQDKLDDLVNLPDCEFIITNIETLRAGSKKIGKYKYSFPVVDLLKKAIEDGEITLLALDECHKAKNSTSLQGRALLQLTAPYMVAMSGTPLMNNPLDLFFPLHWLEYENHDLYNFRNHYCVLGGYSNAEVIGYKNLDQLKEMMESVMIRRLKSEVFDLPEKLPKEEYVDMNKQQEILYKEMLQGVKSELHKVKFSNNPLSLLIRLRQATGNPQILTEEPIESAKLQRMMDLVEEVVSSDGKCIVFSNWEQVTAKAKELLEQYNPAYITGDIKAEERMIEVNRFQNSKDCKVIIGTIGAMGTGLTLTAAQTVIFLDEPWNRALKDQAEDRAHRIGTTGTVNIITIMCKNTIDDRIHDIVYRKGLMSDLLIDGKATKIDMNIINQLIS